MQGERDASSHTKPDATFVSRYAGSMPAEYRARFHEAAIRSHAGIVLRRGANASHLEPWGDYGGATAVCVVADDAPGLLSLVSLGILLAITTALFRARVKILRSDATISAGLARNRFLVAEFDGRPVGPARRQEVEADVLAAIQRKRGVA